MSNITYTQARTALDALTLEALLTAEIGGAPPGGEGVDLVGYDDFSTPKALIHNAAVAGASEQAIRAQLAGALDPAVLVTLDPAWVDVIMGGAYEEARFPAVATQGTLVVSVTSSATYQAGDLLVEDTTIGAYFRNTNAAPITVSPTSPKVIPFVAVTPGAVSNPLGGDTFVLTSGPAGASIGVTVATWTRTQAGADAETNAAYVARCLAKWGSLGAGGNIDAYNYWIPTALGAGFRWLIRNDNPAGPYTLWVILADASGPASGGEIAKLNAYLQPRKSMGSGALTIYAAATHTINLTATSTQDGSNLSVLANQGAALALLVAAFPLGGTLDLALVMSLLRGEPVGSVDVQVPSGFESCPINAPGFGGVTDVSTTFTTTTLFPGEVLAVTPSLS